MQNNNLKKNTIRKPGRTLVVKSDDTIDTTNLNGLQNSVNTTKGTQFLVFDTVDNSKDAFKLLKDLNLKVRFAHYRIFFTMVGVEDSVSYNDLKTKHIDWIVQNSAASVLYYKQYRKGGKFLGCGDFTIDTKESMDKLLDKDTLKNYTLEKYNGTFYRYNKKTDNEQLENA